MHEHGSQQRAGVGFAVELADQPAAQGDAVAGFQQAQQVAGDQPVQAQGFGQRVAAAEALHRGPDQGVQDDDGDDRQRRAHPGVFVS